MLLLLRMLVAMLGAAFWLPLKGIDRDCFEQLQARDQRNN